MITEEQIVLAGHGSGTPSLKNCYSYNESRYQSLASNGKHKGVVCVKRLKMLKDEDLQRYADKYKTIIGRNHYNQNLRQYVYKPYGNMYYSDCSSSICATYQEIGCDVSLLNTAGIFYSPLFEDVNVSIVAGHIQNPDALRIGDCLLYVGNDPSRPLQIGHVESVFDIVRGLEEYPIEATFTIEANVLNIRKEPNNTSEIVGTYNRGALVKSDVKSGEWFRTDRGWISRKYVRGWIKEDNKYWWMDCGAYPINTIIEINGEDYAFDRDGWMLEPNRISNTGAIIY